VSDRVLADGCFDPLHLGHIKYLAAAAKLGRPLIVQIAPDTSILAKGRQPFQTREERAMTVLSLDMVDLVRCYDSLAIAVLSTCPRYLVKGSDWRGKLPEDVLKACQEAETEIIYTDTRERSSSERIHELYR
jgi:D-glycero-beta-D-manno-heptose 1-phosphate adenylyltransferase